MPRKENFSQEEKTAVIDFVLENRHVIEDKSSDMKLHSVRQEKWKTIATMLSSMGTPREWKEVRAAYQRWKTAAKRSISRHRKQQKTTGGGPAVPPPSDADYKIMTICPLDFEEDENPLDSDGLRRAGQPEESSSYEAYELDPATGELVPVGQPLRQSPTPPPVACAVAATDSTGDGAIPSTSKRCADTPSPVEPVAKKAKLTAYEELLYKLQVQANERALMQKEEEHQLRMEILRRQLEGEADEREKKQKLLDLQIKILEKQLEKDM